MIRMEVVLSSENFLADNWAAVLRVKTTRRHRSRLMASVAGWYQPMPRAKNTMARMGMARIEPRLKKKARFKLWSIHWLRFWSSLARPEA